MKPLKCSSEASAGLAQKLYAEQADSGVSNLQANKRPGDEAMDAESFEEV